MGSEITRVEALEAALNGDLRPEIVEKLTVMLEQLRKPSKKKETKEDRERAALVNAAVAAIREHGAPVTTTWLMEHVKGLGSSQKVGAIMRTAIKNGDVIKSYDDKGKPVYSA